MSALYLTEQGANLCRQGRRLIVKKEGETILAVPVHRLDRVVIMGRLQITADATALLLDRNIPVVLLSSRGRIRGCIIPPLNPDVNLRRNQYNLASDPDYCQKFASAVVNAKVQNCRTVLRRYNYNHSSELLKKSIDNISELCLSLNSKTPIRSLMGVEGIVAREYFGALVGIFKKLEIGFGGRIRRPPRDPVNAVMSFTYVLLTNYITSLIQTNGMDPFLGLMHKPNRNAPALSLDIVEEFRQPFGDRFLFLIFNKGILKASDFISKNNGAVFLKREAKNRFLEQWEQWLVTTQRLVKDSEMTSPIAVMREQVENCRLAFLGESLYQPFLLRG